jgi:hypothetical protein
MVLFLTDKVFEHERNLFENFDKSCTFTSSFFDSTQRTEQRCQVLKIVAMLKIENLANYLAFKKQTLDFDKQIYFIHPSEGKDR